MLTKVGPRVTTQTLRSPGLRPISDEGVMKVVSVERQATSIEDGVLVIEFERD
jgi:hypothetical protein